MRGGYCTFLLLLALVQPAHPFMTPALALFYVERDAARPRSGGRKSIGICSMKQPPSSDERAENNKNGPDEKGRRRGRRNSSSNIKSSISRSSQNLASDKRPRRPPSTLPSGAPPRAAGRSVERERPITNAGPDPPVADMHVLVPVKDVVAVPLTDISQAAADSLGGGEATRVSIERFCKTLESVCRTDFSVKVDRANAGLVLGGRRCGNTSSRSRRPATGAELGAPVAGEIMTAAAALSTGEQANASAGDKGKRGKWGMALRRGKQSKAADGSEKKEASPSLAQKKAKRRNAAGEAGGNGAGTRRNGGGAGGDVDSADEIAVIPLLQLVEELVKNAMFSPIGARDVMMSQALAAEFPTAAGVRPVFGNLANVYELLRRHGGSADKEREGEGEGGAAAATEDCSSRGKGGRGGRISDSERALLPFEGKLLMFRRGNGVEETKGRLLLKKLDYLQSNAVGWLSQSITNSFKACQQQVITVVDTVARDLARRKDSIVRSCVEGAIAFGLERESLARFLPVANVTTEFALTKEQEALNEALDALRRNSRRGVNLQRYGMRQVNVKLEEFSDGGAWPPGDDSWFWDTSKQTGALDEEETGEDGFATEGEEVPSTVLPRVTLASVLSPPTAPRRTPDKAKRITSGSSTSTSKSKSKSVLKRLLSKCTVKEPTYDEVVVVYFKRTRRPIFRTPSAVTGLWKLGSRVGNCVRGVEQADTEPEDADEVKDVGLGLQLRVYRGVPLVNLNAIAPDKKVEVRPQTALRLDLNSVVGLGLVLANLRFDSPVLVVAATVSVVLLVIRTIVGYLNARIRVESFVSRDILDKTMGSNVPVLRHLAEEAAQQKSRHVALVYAALLQCAIDTCPEPATATGADDAASDGGVEWGDLSAVSVACVGRHCGVIMKACVGLAWEAKVDVPHWLKELENLKILVRVDGEADASVDVGTRRSLPLALEGLNKPSPKAEAAATEAEARSSAVVVFYRLLDPDAAVEQLKSKWSELVEPPAAATFSESDGGSGGGSSSRDGTPWARKGGVAA